MPIVRHALAPALLLALVALPATSAAQARGTRDTVPVQLLPPAGKCRIWMEGVPAAQQPAPTDCSTALRQKPSNGVVLYGPAPKDAGTERFDPKGAAAAPRTGSRTTAPRASTAGNARTSSSTEPTRPSTPAEPASKAPPEGKRKPE